MLYERKSTAHLVGKWAYMEIVTGWEYFYKLEGLPPNTQILLQFGFIYMLKKQQPNTNSNLTQSWQTNLHSRRSAELQ